MPEDVGVAIMVGGKLSNTGGGRRIARVLVPWVPAIPPNYEDIVAVVKKVVDVWTKYALPGERIADMIERIGWSKFVRLTEVPLTTEVHLDRPFKGMKWTTEVMPSIRDVL